ncbi:DUF2254 domain-containing protein [Microlunatus ginsengisoli]|uniref:DUF2254 domain-containing protein n=1 Tax=Microlunatus ginsengisoli TaxID=363863 RepID=A0ABP6ZDI0_9ACTN
MSHAVRILRRVGAAFADTTRTQLWPIPTFGIALALAGAAGLTQLDAVVDQRLPGSFTTWIFGGDADAARSILSSLATALITVTSLTFSLTVVTLQLASSQFSPRLLRTFTRDRFVQLTLALFLGTFVFALTVLRTVRAGDDQQPEFVPRIAVTVTYLLTIASVIGLVLFLAHLAEEIRVETMLRNVHAEASETVRRTLEGSDADPNGRVEPTAEALLLCAARSGFLTSLRVESLIRVAAELNLIVLVDRPAGASVVAGTPIGFAWSPAGATLAPADRDSLLAAFASAVGIGFERTSLDDISYGLRQLTDVATKALSPGVNDPTTATHALGHSSALLCTLTGLPLGDERLRDDAGTVRLIRRRPDLADLLELAVDQPRRYGAGEPQVVERLYRLLRDVGWSTGRRDHHDAVRRELERLRTTMADADSSPGQRERYDQLGRDVEAALEGRWPLPEADRHR